MNALLLCAAFVAAGGLAGKPLGLLILGEGGDGAWKEQQAMVAKRLGKSLPWEFSAGELDQKLIQKAVERLEAQKVRKVVVLSLIHI